MKDQNIKRKKEVTNKQLLKEIAKLQFRNEMIEQKLDHIEWKLDRKNRFLSNIFSNDKVLKIVTLTLIISASIKYLFF